MPAAAGRTGLLGIAWAASDIAVDGDRRTLGLFRFCSVAKGVRLCGALLGVDVGDRFRGLFQEWQMLCEAPSLLALVGLV